MRCPLGRIWTYRGTPMLDQPEGILREHGLNLGFPCSYKLTKNKESKFPLTQLGRIYMPSCMRRLCLPPQHHQLPLW
jgi:hypothetical protein